MGKIIRADGTTEHLGDGERPLSLTTRRELIQCYKQRTFFFYRNVTF